MRQKGGGPGKTPFAKVNRWGKREEGTSGQLFAGVGRFQALERDKAPKTNRKSENTRKLGMGYSNTGTDEIRN